MLAQYTILEINCSGVRTCEIEAIVIITRIASIIMPQLCLCVRCYASKCLCVCLSRLSVQLLNDTCSESKSFYRLLVGFLDFYMWICKIGFILKLWLL